MAKDLFVSLEDRAGELARVGETLGEAGINIEGVMGYVHDGRGFAHILVDDAVSARRTLEAAGIKVESETDVLVFQIAEEEDRPGAMGARARGAADAGVNLRFLYMATKNRVVIGADDLDAAGAVMGV